MRKPESCPLMPLVGAILLLTAAAAPAADWFGSYLPLYPGAVWIYEDFDNPIDTYSLSVLATIEYEGHPAYRYGESTFSHTIIQRAGGVLTLCASVEDGLLYDFDQDVVLAEVVDGATFATCIDGVCDASLVRTWEAIDPALRSLYDMNPNFHAMIVLASYDGDYPPNLHNVTMSSNLPVGATAPSGAVSNLEWYLPDWGMVAEREVDAATGGMGPRYVLVRVSPVNNQPPAPEAVVLDPAVPNPFNPRTTLRYSLGTATAVTLRIHDCAGRLVRTLVDGEQRGAGGHTVAWKGDDDHGRPLPSGSYIARLEAGSVTSTQRLTLIR